MALVAWLGVACTGELKDGTGVGGQSGSAGPAGSSGASGSGGGRGAAGQSGDAGTTGAAGSPGNGGATGAAGSTGRGGSTGAAGATGSGGSNGTGGGIGSAGNPNGSCSAGVPARGQPANTSSPTTVVGTGTAASCTFGALQAAVTKGGVITFNCGAGAVTISVTATLNVPIR